MDMNRSTAPAHRPHRAAWRPWLACVALATACVPALAGFTNERTLVSLPAQDWVCKECQAPPTMSTDGFLYGTFEIGGANGLGVLYGFDPRRGYKVMYDFTAEAGHPVGYLTQGTDGAFYGIAGSGGKLGGGAAYRITRTGHLKILHDFQPGISPVSLMQASDGNFYGIAAAAGSNGLGFIFRFDRSGGRYRQLYSFAASGPHGTPPGMQLMQAFDDNLYGTTAGGGSNGTGAVYRFGLDGTFQEVYSFGKPGSDDGMTPNSRLLMDFDGTLIGTTQAGGQHGLGTVYHVDVFGKESVAHAFEGPEGSAPLHGVTSNPDGTIYGVTELGGADGGGTAFRMDVTGKFELLYSFGDKHTDGVDPGGLTWGTDGNLYGITYSAGKYGNGTFFGLRLKPER
jgi:uncharacterized repeat protein (TIGR03803 family)